MPEHDGTGEIQRDLFQTDEQLARRLEQVENGLAHLEAALPALRREINRVRLIAFPAPAERPAA